MTLKLVIPVLLVLAMVTSCSSVEDDASPLFDLPDVGEVRVEGFEPIEQDEPGWWVVEASEAGSSVKEERIPPPALLPIGSDVLFSLGSAEIVGGSEELDALAADLQLVLADRAELVVYINGHTDDAGTSDFNYDLALRRANAVRDYLVGGGVPAESLQTVSWGEGDPIASNDTELGRSQNRRVTITFEDAT